MALQPSLRPLIVAGRHDAPHTLDIFRKCLSITACLVADFFLSRLCLSLQVHLNQPISVTAITAGN
jgi:hypothetical protein